jgi:hypothetical protein
MAEDKREPGRPSPYKPEYAQKLIDYFSVQPYSEKIKKIVTKKGDVIEVPFDEAADFPTLAGFAISIGVHRDTLHEWSKVHPEFSDAYARAKDFQENFLVINGLKGLVKEQFGQFVTKNVLGWRDKQPGEADVIVNNVTSKSDDELDARLKELLAKQGSVEP